MGEYAAMIIGSGMAVTLFLGGWSIPFGPTISHFTGLQLHFEAGNTTDEGYSTVASFQTELTDADPRQNYRAQCPCLYSNGNERTFFYPAELALSAELRDWPTPASIGLIRPSGSTGLELRDGTMEIPRGHRLGGDITIYNPRNITTDRYITVRYSVQETLAQQRLGLTVVSMLAAIIPPLASLRLAKKDRTRLGSIVEGAVLCAFSFALLFIVLVIANYMTSSAVGDKMVDVLPAAIVTVVVTFFVEKSKTDKAQGTRISMGRRPERPKMAKHSPRDNEGRDVEESKGM